MVLSLARALPYCKDNEIALLDNEGQ